MVFQELELLYKGCFVLKGEAFCTMRKMGIQEKRFIRRNVYFVVAFVLFLSRVAEGMESKWEEQEPLLAYLISSGDINEEMAELLLINCRLELLHSKRTLQDLELDSDDLLRNSLTRRKARDMALEIKQILVDCLRRKNIVQYYPKERELTQTFGEETVNPGYSPTEEDESPGSASDVQSSTHKTIIIAVTVTASGSFVVALLLFICCHKYCGTGSGQSRNDESPLLSLRMSDYSMASSMKSHSLGALESEEKLGHQSFINKSNAGGNFHMDLHSLSNSRTENGASLNSVNNLPLPPGMKPPPGRTNLPKPPMNIEVPPPPPAGVPPRPPPGPPPPPPVKSLSGAPCPPAPGPPPPPPIPSGVKGGPQPPPPPRVGATPPRPPPVGLKPPRPGTSMDQGDDGGVKAKLKPFFWDKVSAGADQSMVWHQIKAGSFQFNEEMMESLFGYAPAGKNKNEAKKESSSQEPQFIQIIDPKKAQNLSILLKALNVTTEEVCDALEEGNELPSELIQTLLKMAPRAEEELKLRLYSGNLSLLGPAERFLKRLVDIPFAFNRLESLLFMCTLEEETSTLRESFVVLEAACTELRKSRLFHKLLEAVLKTGNRMNDGTFRGGAQAFKLDTLLKLSDVRGADGKTTLLHFVVQEIIRSEGIRAARAAREMRSMSSFKSEDLHHDCTQHSDEQLRSLGLQVVSSLSNELENVKRAAILDADSLTGTVAKLGESLIRAKNSLNSDMKDVAEDNGFHQTLKSFVENAEVEVMQLLEEENKTMELVKVTADYFHGHSGRDEGLRLFAVVRDFLIILDKVCREVKNTPRNVNKTQNKEDLVATPSDPRQTTRAIADRRVDSSSSDDEVDSSSSEDEN